jgi:hypothetical protein
MMIIATTAQATAFSNVLLCFRWLKHVNPITRAANIMQPPMRKVRFSVDKVVDTGLEDRADEIVDELVMELISVVVVADDILSDVEKRT